MTTPRSETLIVDHMLKWKTANNDPHDGRIFMVSGGGDPKVAQALKELINADATKIADLYNAGKRDPQSYEAVFKDMVARINHQLETNKAWLALSWESAYGTKINTQDYATAFNHNIRNILSSYMSAVTAVVITEKLPLSLEAAGAFRSSIPALFESYAETSLTIPLKVREKNPPVITVSPLANEVATLRKATLAIFEKINANQYEGAYEEMTRIHKGSKQLLARLNYKTDGNVEDALRDLSEEDKNNLGQYLLNLRDFNRIFSLSLKKIVVEGDEDKDTRELKNRLIKKIEDDTAKMHADTKKLGIKMPASHVELSYAIAREEALNKIQMSENVMNTYTTKITELEAQHSLLVTNLKEYTKTHPQNNPGSPVKVFKDALDELVKRTSTIVERAKMANKNMTSRSRLESEIAPLNQCIDQLIKASEKIGEGVWLKQATESLNKVVKGIVTSLKDLPLEEKAVLNTQAMFNKPGKPKENNVRAPQAPKPKNP